MKLRDAEERCVLLGDGTALRYYVVGRGPAVLLANGLAAPREVWRDLVAQLSDRYRFLFWHYRGLDRDSADPHVDAGVTAHAADACAILDAEGVARAAVIGWAMGVQVALELFDCAPGRVASLVLINGGARPAWAKGDAQGPKGKLIAQALRVAAKAPRLLDALARNGLRAPEAFTWARRLGLVGEQIDADAFAQISGGLLQLDIPAYIDALQRLARHDSTPLLHCVDVPTLVIGGDRDPFTTRASLERLAREIRGAEYLMLPGATHYALLDHAERINLRIEKFWNERGYLGRARTSMPPGP
jgi:pimeloyl-ACP methyl ester carboxylesterase